MIDITIDQDAGGVKRVSSKGHAAYGEYGTDIVCAAVSVLVINTLNAIEHLVGDDHIDNEISPGIIDRSYPNGLSHDGQVLMDAMIMGLKETEKQYGSEYITLSIKEV
ncbi:MAG: ribosomal-processing cysteine protease Prp [Lachnospiraceae bacterium]|nr:ribosomal-processing cysteine protease Prp [Lachnospiraceae bacterium]